MDMAVEASDLTKYFGDLLAVDHINLEIDRREIFGFLGPNGAGKTTTVRMLTGILKPSDGRVYVLGYDVQREALKAKRLMGIVPEMANAYIDLSAWQNLLFMGEIYGVPRGVREKRSEELLKLFGSTRGETAWSRASPRG